MIITGAATSAYDPNEVHIDIRAEEGECIKIGGDEFVVILKGCDYEKREELEGSFRKTIDENQRNGLVVVSSGMAVYQPEKEDTYNDVFKRADQLMYERKQALKTAAKQQA